jgi:hypothetical protein
MGISVDETLHLEAVRRGGRRFSFEHLLKWEENVEKKRN